MDWRLKVEGVGKSYGARPVLRSVSLVVRAGECVGVLGKNGSGKTTLARIIAGLEAPDHGTVAMASKESPLLVQQDFVVWPHLSVEENVALGLRPRPGADEKRVMAQWIERLELASMARAKAGTLSHGQQQRVSLARALTRRAGVLVLDEAFSNLDAVSRAPLLEGIRLHRRETGAALVWIGHEWRDIAGLCERVAVLAGGRVAQEATPEEIYHRPASEEIAVMGGAVNVVSARRWAELRLRATENCEAEARVGWRPEHWRLLEHPDGVPVECVEAISWGPGYMVGLRLKEAEVLKLWSPRKPPERFRGKFELEEDACIHVWRE